MQSAVTHVKEIESVAAGQQSHRESLVIRSWLRCLKEYQLDPTLRGKAYIVTGPELREHQQQADGLIRMSRSALDRLYAQVAGYNYMLLLADARGVAVTHYRNSKTDDALRAAGLYIGANWSEGLTGTNAVGVCLAECQPVTVHQDDHFDSAHIGLTCSAAPVFDTLGILAAVVDISQLHSATQRSSQQLANHLVTDTARRVELANLIGSATNQWVLRLSRSPDSVDADPEAAIAVDGDGCIRGMTHAAFKALFRHLGLTGCASASLIGRPINELFDLDADTLPQFISGRPAYGRVLCAKGQPVLFATTEPPSSSTPCAGTVQNSSQVAELPEPLARLASHSQAMARLAQRAVRLADRGLSVLIQGETGTGKEVLARAIHAARPDPGPFIAVNCAAMPEQLIESELFGYAPNTFTGAAHSGKVGLIEAANGGTLFLDEIGDMPLELQSRLLRVLAERCLTPLGSVKSRPVTLRVISATHVPLRERVASGTFREDLFYRLSAAVLQLPPLRQRDDFNPLVNTLLAEISAEQGRRYGISRTARDALSAYAWPGNVRELRNVLAVAAALCEPRQSIDLEDLPEEITAANARSSLEAQLAECGGNVSELARRIGVDRTTIHRRLNRLRSN